MPTTAPGGSRRFQSIPSAAFGRHRLAGCRSEKISILVICRTGRRLGRSVTLACKRLRDVMQINTEGCRLSASVHCIETGKPGGSSSPVLLQQRNGPSAPMGCWGFLWSLAGRHLLPPHTWPRDTEPDSTQHMILIPSSSARLGHTQQEAHTAEI